MENKASSRLQALRREFGKNKTIPKRYELSILTALSHYPEVKDLRIVFRLKKWHSRPYTTYPDFSSLFRAPSRRKYIITLREHAKPPLLYALMKKLPFEAQVGVIAHEIAHVVQYDSCNNWELAKMLLQYFKPAFQRKMERMADLGAILHGLGRELLEHAIYIRSIPGYVQERKEINKNYMKPKEIRKHLKLDAFFET